MSAVLAEPPWTYDLPAGREATAPPEARGVPRDGVRLLVASGSGLAHRRFRELPEVLAPGDLLVVNTSATLPAAVDAVLPGRAGARERTLPLHVSTVLDDGRWVVELRRSDGSGPAAPPPGAILQLPGGVALRVGSPYPHAADRASRLWTATTAAPTDLVAFLETYGRPIGYSHLAHPVELADLQNVYAREPGSAEMASAGRPLTASVLVGLMARGVVVAPLVLHAGVSSQEAHEPPMPERYAVPAATARLVNDTRRVGGRVLAVGTTVVRALETRARPDGLVSAGRGWTDLVLGPHRPARVVDGLISGLHPPEASHLRLLDAVAGPQLVRDAYLAAVARDYRWHEFGDSMLFLP